MSENLDAMLETDEPEDTPDVAEPQAEAPKEEEAAEEAKAPEATTEPEVPTEPPVPTEAEPETKSVPMGAMLDERDKRKALEAELQQLRQQQQPAPEPQEVPDVFEFPEENQKYWENRISSVEQAVEQRLLNTKLDMSEQRAAQAHGTAAVDEAKEWFTAKAGTDPAWARQVLQQADPYDYAINERKKEQMLGQLTADPAKLEQVLSMLNGEAQPTPVAPTTTATARSVSARKGPDYSGPESLQELLGET